MLMLENIRLIDPASRTDDIRDILISEHKFIKIGTDLRLDAVLIAEAKGERLNVIDCTGLAAAPGLVDAHVHFRDPGYTYKEDIQSGTAAAAAGGFTSVICMANTNPKVDSEETILEVMKKGRNTPVHVYTCACMTKNMEGQELVDMKFLKECGAVGFSDDGKPVLNETLAQEAMRTARGIKMPLAFHEEDPAYIKEPGIDHGPAAEKMGLTGADRQAEITLVNRDCKLARETGATVVIQHVSAKESLDIIRKAKRNGAKVWAEVTPQHFSLTEDAVAQFGTAAKVNPPLRTEEDRKALIEGLKDGTIDYIATDHAPHSKDEKDKPFTEAPSGMTGLETSLSLGIMNLVIPGYLSLGQLIAKMSYEPARLYSLEAGVVRDDAEADLTVFDPQKTWAYLAPKSKASNSPWLGKTLTGKVMMTVISGEVAYKAQDFGDRTDNRKEQIL